MAAAQVLQLLFFAGLAVSLVGRAILPEPYAKFLENNQMAVLGMCFMGNLVAGNLLNTGAFEVGRAPQASSRPPARRRHVSCSPSHSQIKYNGELVWSKLETGKFPQMDELRNALAAVMH